MKQVKVFDKKCEHPGVPFVTDWDLSVCLQYECKRKQILKPAYLNSWIDLRATYRVSLVNMESCSAVSS